MEIGTLGGYSSVCIARGLGEGGVLHTFELQEKFADVARESFRRAVVEDRVRIHVGTALERLPTIAGEAPFDLLFIDADKVGYPSYLAWGEEHLRVGGVVLADNAFGWGGVAEPDHAGERYTLDSIQSLRTFSERLARGGRFRATMIPTEEGLAMGVKVR